MRWQTGSNVHVLSNTLDTGCLMEVTRGDSFSVEGVDQTLLYSVDDESLPNDIKVGASRNHL